MGVSQRLNRADPVAMGLQTGSQFSGRQGRQILRLHLQVVGKDEAGHGSSSVTKTLEREDEVR